MLVVAAATLGRHHVRGRLRAGHRPRPAPAGRRRGRGPVRRRAGHLGAGRPSHRDGQHCLRGRRALQLTPWAVRRARRFCTILAASIGLALVVSVAKIPVIGILVAASVTGGFGTTSAVLLVRLARDPQNHVTAAHHPAASHRGLGRQVIVGGLACPAVPVRRRTSLTISGAVFVLTQPTGRPRARGRRPRRSRPRDQRRPPVWPRPPVPPQEAAVAGGGTLLLLPGARALDSSSCASHPMLPRIWLLRRPGWTSARASAHPTCGRNARGDPHH